MTNYDVFNGDADGICSLLQLRLAEPCSSELISGIKRDINLLAKVSAKQNDQITVLDVSLDKNRQDLSRNLDQGANIIYFDHHFCGEIPDHPKLWTSIDTQPNICTSLLVNQYLSTHSEKKSFPLWAISGAFGDNLNQSAHLLGKQLIGQGLDLAKKELDELHSLGVYINYNGYGATLTDLHFAPDELYKKLLDYQNPLDVIADKNSVYQPLKSAYKEDNAHVSLMKAEHETPEVAVFILPNQAWARRISGVYSNDLVNKFPDRAHAVLTKNEKNGYLISVRAPLNNKTGADELCRQFESGGGRKAAAGINHLPQEDLSLFIKKFSQQFNA